MGTGEIMENNEINEAKQKMIMSRRKSNDAVRISVENLRLAKSNLFMDKVLWAIEVFFMVSIIISIIAITYMLMFIVFVKLSSSFFMVLSISWIPMAIGYIGWAFLSKRAMKRRMKVLKDLQEFEEIHKKVIEMQERADALIHKIEKVE